MSLPIRRKKRSTLPGETLNLSTPGPQELRFVLSKQRSNQLTSSIRTKTSRETKAVRMGSARPFSVIDYGPTVEKDGKSQYCQDVVFYVGKSASFQDYHPHYLD